MKMSRTIGHAYTRTWGTSHVPLRAAPRSSPVDARQRGSHLIKAFLFALDDVSPKDSQGIITGNEFFALLWLQREFNKKPTHERNAWGAIWIEMITRAALAMQQRDETPVILTSGVSEPIDASVRPSEQVRRLLVIA